MRLANTVSVLAMVAAACSPLAAADERPDLQGFWTNQSVTKLERPEGADKLVVTEAEAIELERNNIWNRVYREQEAGVDVNSRPEAGGAEFGTRGYNAFWIDPGRRLTRIGDGYRTSMVVEPANGRVPWKPDGRQELQRTSGRPPIGSFDGIETRPLAERCLMSFSNSGGPVMLNGLYNNTYQFVQAPDHVMILVEMNHDARIIPTFATAEEARANARPRAIAQWMGDSVGWYEDGALVVETVNPNPWQRSLISATGKVTERFIRDAEDHILYQFTVEDPTLYTQVWKGEMAFTPSTEPLYEYACHEGNYAMEGILGGARVQEAAGVAVGSNAEVER
ncbi:hypothetical protein GC169_08045 [bacterium]|nr:hypothetical protein [bacterium]